MKNQIRLQSTIVWATPDTTCVRVYMECNASKAIDIAFALEEIENISMVKRELNLQEKEQILTVVLTGEKIRKMTKTNRAIFVKQTIKSLTQ